MMSMYDLIDAVRDFLDKDDWKYEYQQEKNVIRSGITLKCKLQSVKLFLIFNETGYTVIATAPLNADESSRPNVMEYLTRANYGLRNGNFEMDVDDGEVRYKSYVNVKGMDTISSEVIQDSIMLPVVMMDRYGDGIAALMFGFSDPVTEIKKVENR